MAAPTSAVTAAAAPAKPTGYIAGPLYDGIFFIGSPLLAMILGLGIAGSPLRTSTVTFGDYSESPVTLFIGAFIMAHLVAVVFRSHGNRTIFKAFPLRFTVVPALLFLGILLSQWVMVAASVLATWWDVYHSSLQTFGLGRIYDVRAGNDARIGRRLDYFFNLLLYAGPILAGATLFDHVDDFQEFAELDDVVAAFFTAIPAQVAGVQSFLTWTIVGLGIPFLAYYVATYAGLARRGYRVSAQKVTLYVLTGLCSIFAWGFNSFGEAFFIMNFFHALQYFALVWWIERKNLAKVLGGGGRGGTLILFLALTGAYGVWAEMVDGSARWAIALISVISLMHFWYDGFIWSVRRPELARGRD